MRIASILWSLMFSELLMCITAEAINGNELVGTWTAIRADVGEIKFEWYKAQLEFSTFLHQQPYNNGEWDLKGDSLFLFGSSGTEGYKIDLSNDTLRLTGIGGEQIFIRKEEWRDLLLYGAYTATTTLKGENWFGDKPGPYSVRNLADGKPKTCWAEGVKGTGIGEKIYLLVNGRPQKIKIINGYGKSPNLFCQNGRVKSFKVTPLAAFMLPGDVTEVTARYRVKRCGPQLRLEIKDLQSKQIVPLMLDWAAISERAKSLAAQFENDFSEEIEGRRSGSEEKFYQRIVLCLEIAEVYPGTKFDDTCVSELGWE